MHRTHLRALAPAVLLLVLAGCGDDDGQDGPEGGDGAAGSWTAAEEPVETSGLVWAADGVVHLPDGTTLETGEDIGAYVVAGAGAYVVPAEEGTDAATGPLLEVTAEGVEETGAEVDPGSLRTSPDGRYLAFIDPVSGEQDEFGTPLATAVVVDLVEGEELVRTTTGMGDPAEDDLADLYEDAGSPGVVGLTDTTAYLTGPDGELAVDLATRDVEPAGSAWYDDLRSGKELTNPAGTWTIVRTDDGSPSRLVPADGGEPVVTRAPMDLYDVDSWLDDRTAVGSGTEDQVSVLLGCTVPSGQCAPLPDVAPGALLPVDRGGQNGPTVR